ncbi:MAG: hypothetical protein WDZ76_02230 [Pseudohongiellaceae bacterium]
MIMKSFLSMVLLLVLAGAIGYFYFESALARGIEIAGSRALGTETRVSSVNISPMSGSGSIGQLSIANPEGFNETYAFLLDSLSVEMDVGSAFSDVVEIDSIVITQPDITYETRITTDNIRALINNLPTGPAAEPGAEGAGKRVIIRDLRIIEPRINLVTALAQAPVSLPDIHLQNIGDQSNAVTIAEAARQILSAISQAVLRADLPTTDELRQGVEDNVTEQLERGRNQIEEEVNNVGDRVRGLFNN